MEEIVMKAIVKTRRRIDEERRIPIDPKATRCVPPAGWCERERERSPGAPVDDKHTRPSQKFLS
jgi:hypothetical protein